MLRYSVTFAGSVLLAHLFSARLLRAATEDYAQQSPSAADLLASMRAKFNAVPMETQKLAENVTMFDSPGGAVTVLNGPDGKFMVDTFVLPAWPKLKEALDGIGNAPARLPCANSISIGAMRILILGGTVFLGRALTDAALAAGHRVTHFNRGKASAGEGSKCKSWSEPSGPLYKTGRSCGSDMRFLVFSWARTLAPAA